MRRKEALEHKFPARKAELKKAFDAKVRDKVVGGENGEGGQKAACRRSSPMSSG